MNSSMAGLCQRKSGCVSWRYKFWLLRHPRSRNTSEFLPKSFDTLFRSFQPAKSVLAEDCCGAGGLPVHKQSLLIFNAGAEIWSGKL